MLGFFWLLHSISWLNKSLALANDRIYFRIRIAENKRFWLCCRRMDTGVKIVGFLHFGQSLTLPLHLGAFG